MRSRPPRFGVARSAARELLVPRSPGEPRTIPAAAARSSKRRRVSPSDSAAMTLLPLDPGGPIVGRAEDRFKRAKSRRVRVEPPAGDVDAPHEGDARLCGRVLEE